MGTVIKMASTGNNNQNHGNGMAILCGFLCFMYFSLFVLLIWFCSVPKNWDKMKRRWEIRKEQRRLYYERRKRMEIEEDCEDDVRQTNIEKTSEMEANDDFEEEDDYDDENNANCELLSHSEELNEPPKPI